MCERTDPSLRSNLSGRITTKTTGAEPGFRRVGVRYSDRYLAYMGLAPKRIPHWEHWSCPDAETYLTGIDYYEHPWLCRLKMRELYPQLDLPIPENDEQKP